MDIEITEKKENPLLKRKEVRFTAEFDAVTPSRKEVKEILAAKLRASPELVLVDSIGQEFGKQRVCGYAKIYDDAEAMKVELKHQIRRDKGEKVEKKKKEAKKPAEKK